MKKELHGVDEFYEDITLITTFAYVKKELFALNIVILSCSNSFSLLQTCFKQNNAWLTAIEERLK